MTFDTFILGLTPAQVRALASQSGYAGWSSVETDVLRARLLVDLDAQAIFAANYPN